MYSFLSYTQCISKNGEYRAVTHDDILYCPLDTLQSTASMQRNALTDAWQNHQGQIQQHIFMPATNLIHGGNTFHQHMTSWH